MPSRDERKTTGNQLLLTSTVCDAYGKAVKSLETFAMLCTQENVMYMFCTCKTFFDRKNVSLYMYFQSVAIADMNISLL